MNEGGKEFGTRFLQRRGVDMKRVAWKEVIALVCASGLKGPVPRMLSGSLVVEVCGGG